MLLIYITTKDIDQAHSIGQTLVEEKLVACVNILPAMESIYRWKGEICSDNESVLIAKTRDDLLEKVTSRVKALHTYECPCVVALPILGGNPAYLKWIGDMTE